MNAPVILVLAALVAAAEGAPAPKTSAQKTFDTKCASCHSKDGRGNSKMLKILKAEAKDLDLVDETTLAKKDEDLVKIIVDGFKKMPSFKTKLGGLAPAELVKYIRSLKSADAPTGK